MSQEQTVKSYAAALNEARQMIVQQQLRIKADAEKVRVQQQTIVDQSSTLTENERRLREQAGEIGRLTDEAGALNVRLIETMTAKTQAEAVVDRQGERLTTLQAAAAEGERRIAALSERVATISGEVDALRSQLPTSEDEAALSSMMDLLSKRTKRPGPAMRLADDREPASDESTPAAEAA